MSSASFLGEPATSNEVKIGELESSALECYSRAAEYQKSADELTKQILAIGNLSNNELRLTLESYLFAFRDFQQLQAANQIKLARKLNLTKLTFQRLENRIKLLEKSSGDASAANKAKSSFLAQMSHELRTPLNGVIGGTSLLLATSQNLSVEQKEVLDLIRTSGETMLNLIGDILDLSKIEAGRIELESRVFSIRSMIESCLDVLADKALSKGIDLFYDVQDDIVNKQIVPHLVVCDESRLKQVIINLLSNSCKFTDRGYVSVTLSSKSVDEQLPQNLDLIGDYPHFDPSTLSMHKFHITCTDTGVGIPNEVQHKLFREFEQTKGTFAKYGGTGLGLMISKQLIERMGEKGGKVWLESKVGVGTTIHVELILPASNSNLPLHLIYDHPELKNKHILIVKRNPIYADVLKRLVEFWGMKCTVKHSFADCVALFNSKSKLPFDVVLCDYDISGADQDWSESQAQQNRHGQPVSELSGNISPPIDNLKPYTSTVASSRVPAEVLISKYSQIGIASADGSRTRNSQPRPMNKNGLDLAAHIRKTSDRVIPILLCIPLSKRKKLMKSIVNYFMSNPIKPYKLFACLVSILRPSNTILARTNSSNLVGLKSSQAMMVQSNSTSAPMRRLMEERQQGNSPEFASQNKRQISKLNSRSKKQTNTEKPQFAKEHPLNILVAEDVDLNCKLIRTMLKRLGYVDSEVTTVSNGKLAFEAVVDRLKNNIWLSEGSNAQSTAKPSSDSIDSISSSSPYTTTDCSSANSTPASTISHLSDGSGRQSSNELIGQLNSTSYMSKLQLNRLERRRTRLDSAGLNAPFDVILMDLNMPIMGGIESTKYINSYCQENDIPKQYHPIIVALTANSMNGDKDACLTTMDFYLSKPLTLDPLSQVLALCHEKLISRGFSKSQNLNRISNDFNSILIDPLSNSPFQTRPSLIHSGSHSSISSFSPASSLSSISPNSAHFSNLTSQNGTPENGNLTRFILRQQQLEKVVEANTTEASQNDNPSIAVDIITETARNSSSPSAFTAQAALLALAQPSKQNDTRMPTKNYYQNGQHFRSNPIHRTRSDDPIITKETSQFHTYQNQITKTTQMVLNKKQSLEPNHSSTTELNQTRIDETVEGELQESDLEVAKSSNSSGNSENEKTSTLPTDVQEIDDIQLPHHDYFIESNKSTIQRALSNENPKQQFSTPVATRTIRQLENKSSHDDSEIADKFPSVLSELRYISASADRSQEMKSRSKLSSDDVSLPTVKVANLANAHPATIPILPILTNVIDKASDVHSVNTMTNAAIAFVTSSHPIGSLTFTSVRSTRTNTPPLLQAHLEPTTLNRETSAVSAASLHATSLNDETAIRRDDLMDSNSQSTAVMENSSEWQQNSIAIPTEIVASRSNTALQLKAAISQLILSTTNPKAVRSMSIVTNDPDDQSKQKLADFHKSNIENLLSLTSSPQSSVESELNEPHKFFEDGKVSDRN